MKRVSTRVSKVKAGLAILDEDQLLISGFEAVTSIIFCVALSEYDQVLLEETTQVCTCREALHIAVLTYVLSRTA